MRSIRSLFRQQPPSIEDPSRYRPEGPGDLDDLLARANPDYAFRPNEQIKHLDGVPWFDAPAPPRRHRCWPQTIGNLRPLETVHRCACGGFSYGDGIWIRRNEKANR